MKGKEKVCETESLKIFKWSNGTIELKQLSWDGDSVSRIFTDIYELEKVLNAVK